MEEKKERKLLKWKLAKIENKRILLNGTPFVEYNIDRLLNIIEQELDIVEKKAIYRDWETDRKSTRLNSSHSAKSRMPSSA